MMKKKKIFIAGLSFIVTMVFSQNGELPAPTHADVAFGPNPMNMLDIWLAPSENPTPLLVFIHGGGFQGGDKRKFSGDMIENMNKEGISVASINYRLTEKGLLAEGKNMYPAPMHDGASALQYLRYHADEYNQVLAPRGGQTCIHGLTLLKWFGVNSLNLSKKEGIIQSSSADDLTAEQLALGLDASPIMHLTSDDPPIYLFYNGRTYLGWEKGAAV